MTQLKFKTAVEITPSKVELTVNDATFFIGSCFADNISSRLADSLFPCFSNPYGAAYNPQSISFQIERIVHAQACTEAELVQNNGMWFSWFAHGKISAATRHETMTLMDQATHDAHKALAEAKIIFVTFGTAWTFVHAATMQTVANCHKLPEKTFVRKRLAVDDIVGVWDKTISTIETLNPQAHIVFTVSPIRHLKDTLHGNQLSKATLLLAADKLAATHANCTYFPAYEILMDDLRDYRFYDDDMAHPSKKAIEYTYNLFMETYLNKTAQKFAAESEKITLALKHRPQQTNNEYYQFINRTIRNALSLKEKYQINDSNLNFKRAIGQLEAIESAKRPYLN